MATLEDELFVLKEKNNELAQKVQYWKMTAADRENEKLDLMKEVNELRLKLSRLRNNGEHQARKLDESLQQTHEKAISYLVKASDEIARSVEIAKTYMRVRQELDAQSPRWSTLGGTPVSERTEKVHRVHPMTMGGQSIQPVVALSRTTVNTSHLRIGQQSPSQNRSMTERALPMYMLQDVYIPLTRIDMSDISTNNVDNDAEEEGNPDDSTEELGLDDGGDRLDESARISEEEEDDDDTFPSRKLHVLNEESDEEESETPRLTLHLDNPLEGPSWLLDSPPDSRSSNPNNGTSLEPDSTTELESKTPKPPCSTPNCHSQREAADNVQPESNNRMSVRLSCEFSPTVRRRKRTSSPPLASPSPHHYSPRPPSSRKNSAGGRVLKVLVAKMRLEAEGGAGAGAGVGAGAGDAAGAGATPKRARLGFDAPSPNGATDSAVFVSETITNPLAKEVNTEPRTSLSRRDSYEALRCRINSQVNQRRVSQENHQPNKSAELENNRRNNTSHDRTREQSYNDRDSVQSSRPGSHDSRDSDSGSGGGGDSICNGRTRRPRKMVTYKEKPLNRKLRR